MTRVFLRCKDHPKDALNKDYSPRKAVIANAVKHPGVTAVK